jgi:hypothetical protein
MRVCAEEEYDDKSAQYEVALAIAARKSGFLKQELRRSLYWDFRVWMKQEGLPKPSRK